MDERRTSHQHRARSRDRSDQRRPTFQILNAVQPRTHAHGKRANAQTHYGVDTILYPYYREEDDDDEMDRHPQPGLASSHLQKRVIGVHTIGNKSVESVNSACRGPACNFAKHHRQTDENIDSIPANDRYRTKNVPADRVAGSRPRSQSPQDRVVLDEPSDLVVWNASKKASSSNLLCPLTESEYRNITVKDTKTIMRAPRIRSNSAPGPVPHNLAKQFNHQGASKTHPSGLPEARNSVLFNVETLCKEAAEMLDDFAPPPMSPIQISPSSSVASTTTSYSVQISLVTQQLEEIQQAQNDVLKHLGEEISKVTGENERLTKELEHIRDQNEGLLKVVHDTTDELERMKHIFRTRGLAHSHTETHDHNKRQDASNESDYPSSQPQQRHQQQRKQQQQQRHVVKRDSVDSNNGNHIHKSPMGDGDPALAHLVGGNLETEANSYLKQTADITVNKPPKRKKSKQLLQQQQQNNMDEQEIRVDSAAATAEDTNDDEVSYRSVVSQTHTKSSKRRGDEHHHRTNHNNNNNNPHHSRADNDHSHHHDQHRRSRSRSKDRNSKSPRNSATYQSSEEKHLRQMEKPVFPDDNEDNIEMRPTGNSCFRFFCCMSSTASRSKTDSVDDMVLRGCPESRIN